MFSISFIKFRSFGSTLGVLTSSSKKGWRPSIKPSRPRLRHVLRKHLENVEDLLIKDPNSVSIERVTVQNQPYMPYSSNTQHVLHASSQVDLLLQLCTCKIELAIQVCSNEKSTKTMDNHLPTSKPFCLPFPCLFLSFLRAIHVA